MAPQKLDKAAWRGLSDRVSKASIGKRAEIEVAPLDPGAQGEAEWLSLLVVSYDPKDDIIEIALDGVDHIIEKPRELYIDETPDGLVSFEVIDRGGVRHIVTLRDPLMLPARSATSS